MDDRHSEHLVRRARDLYRRQARQLPPEMSRRLAAARREALERARKPMWSPLWVPAGAVAAGLLAIAVLQVRGPEAEGDGVLTAGPAVEDMEMLFDGEDLELLEDLEFYAWLGTDPDAG
jgi:hypothetical protein